MSIDQKITFNNITVRDLVANVTEGVQPGRISRSDFSATLDMSLAEKLLTLDSGDEQDNAGERKDGFPVFIEANCLAQVQVIFDFAVHVNSKEAGKGQQVASYMCLYDVTYSIKERIDEMDDFKAYVEKTAYQAAWPYFRNSARMMFISMGFQVAPPLPVDPFAG